MDGGNLSQDEINALLNGMMAGDSPDAGDSTTEPVPDGGFNNEPLMQDTASSSMSDIEPVDESLLNDIEKDAIGEVANISMGTSATTLFSLVNRKVNITTPVVELANWNSIVSNYEKPCVFIYIKYTIGLDGSNILVLKENDVKIITDLMMGGDGTNIDGELGELHLSAISEAMNQMMGSSATSLSSMLGKKIDISPPEANLIDLQELENRGDLPEFLKKTFVKISFRMQIDDDLVDSTIMQLYPIDFAKSLYETFMGSQMGDSEPAPEASAPAAPSTPPPPPAPAMPAPDQSMGGGYGMPDMSGQQMNNMGMGMNPMGMQPMGMNPMMNPMGMNPMGMQPMGMNPMMGMPMMQPMQNVSVQPAQFQGFAPGVTPTGPQENIDLIKDVPLEVTVELGRTNKSISEILDFSPGTIIELDKIAGEPIDVLVNGKFVARGEVVVIEESFGVRVTEIIK
ncbi:MAG: flagellar motor switch phosphatase FliY [Lachnospiraceae bacterium]|nr:flagellar motor switch phosphatase FliY [Candidatus Merdinaster equi]